VSRKVSVEAVAKKLRSNSRRPQLFMASAGATGTRTAAEANEEQLVVLRPTWRIGPPSTRISLRGSE
jgi:hypothetical protein